MRDLWGLARERQRGWRGQCCGRSSAWLWRTQPLGPCDLSRKLGVAAAPPLLEKEAHPLVLAGFGAPSAHGLWPHFTSPTSAADSATALCLTYIINNSKTSQGVAQEGRKNPEKVFRNSLRGSHRKWQEENPEWGTDSSVASVASHLHSPLMQPQKTTIRATRALQEPQEPSLSLPSSG